MFSHLPSPGGRRVALAILAATAPSWRLAVAQPPKRPAPEELRIGYHKSAANLVVIKQNGWLERKLPRTRVSWVEFPVGPQLLEALAVGRLDFGVTGDSPPVFAQGASKDLLYVGAEPPKPDRSAILVLRNSPPNRLDDLRGRKIAVQKGSSAHYLLVRAADKAGLAWSEIQPIYLAPAEARAAFERGAVDAWAIWAPLYATELALPTRALATGRDISSNSLFYLASRSFAAQGDTLRLLLEELSRADRFIQTQRPEAIKLIASFSGLDAGVVSLFLQRRPPSPVGPLKPETVADQQRVADIVWQGTHS